MLDANISPPVNLRDLAVLLDVDGTILDIAPTPHDVRVPPALRRSLESLAQQSGGAVALVSGRPVTDIDRLFAPLQLPALGGHGAEIRLQPDGVAQALATPLALGLRQQVSAITAYDPGILVEDKGYALAVHYRLAPEQEPIIKAAVAAIQADLAVIEIKAKGFDKGMAIRELMRHQPFADRRPIFIGDDITDDAAFAVLPEFRGVGFSVGRQVPGTAHCFDAPADVRRWLQALSDGTGTLRP